MLTISSLRTHYLSLNGIGSCILFNTKDISFPKVTLIRKTNLNANIPSNQLNTLYIKDDYAREGICKLVEEHTQVMTKATTPGCGKS
jgi:hypothetical protein